MNPSPGPWRWSADGVRLEDANGSPIVGMNRASGGIYMPGGVDARLLEAAWELLAALRSVLDDCDGLHLGSTERARRLIARIEET